MALEASSSISWVTTVLDAAQRHGAPQAQVLALAGIDPAELQLPRWPIDHIARLWRAAVQATQDPGFGLKVGASVQPASLNVVGYLLQSAPTLRAALALVQQYQSLVSDGGRFQTIAGQGCCWLIYHPRQGSLAFSPHQVEAVLAAVVVFHDPWLGVVLALAMICNQVVAALGGVLVPLGMSKLKLDPALASGTFVTTLTDVMGYLAFLGFAALLLL